MNVWRCKRKICDQLMNVLSTKIRVLLINQHMWLKQSQFASSINAGVTLSVDVFIREPGHDLQLNIATSMTCVMLVFSIRIEQWKKMLICDKFRLCKLKQLHGMRFIMILVSVSNFQCYFGVNRLRNIAFGRISCRSSKLLW